MADIKSTVEEVIQQTARNDDWLREHPPETEWFGWKAEPWYQDPDHPFIKTVMTHIEGVCGRMVEAAGNTAGLDTRFSGYFGFPALTFGPQGDNYHGFDEYVDLDTLLLATKTIALATLDWCSRDK